MRPVLACQKAVTFLDKKMHLCDYQSNKIQQGGNIMNNVAVIYKTQYGTTKQYAQWIAEALEATLFEVSEIKPAQLMSFDTIVYGGGLYAGGIDGVKLVTKNPCKNLVVFTVGLDDSTITDFSEVLTRNFTQELLSQTTIFHLRGGIDYSKLNLIHKGMMAFVKNQAAKKAESELTINDRLLLETYGKQISFVDKDTIAPLVAFVKGQ